MRGASAIAPVLDDAETVPIRGEPRVVAVLGSTSDYAQVRNLKMLEGSYTFTPVDGATEVVYALTVEPNFKVPGFVRRQAEKQIVTTALRGLRKRVLG